MLLAHIHVGRKAREPPCPLPKLGTSSFYSVVYSLLESITETGHLEVEGSHLVMNTEVSQDSVLGQILGSKQMSIIRADGAGRDFSVLVK